MPLQNTFVAGLDAQDLNNIRLVVMPADQAAEYPWPDTMRAWKKAPAFKRFWISYLADSGISNTIVIVQTGTPSELVHWITQRDCEVLWLSQRSAQTFLTESEDLEIEKPYQRAHALALSGAYRLKAQNMVHDTFVQVRQIRHHLDALASKLERLSAALPVY